MEFQLGVCSAFAVHVRVGQKWFFASILSSPEQVCLSPLFWRRPISAQAGTLYRYLLLIIRTWPWSQTCTL